MGLRRAISTSPTLAKKKLNGNSQGETRQRNSIACRNIAAAATAATQGRYVNGCNTDCVTPVCDERNARTPRPNASSKKESASNPQLMRCAEIR